MKGLALFTLVIVLPLVLNIIPSVVGSAQCGSNGEADDVYPNICNCYSAYAPSDTQQDNCNYLPSCPLYPGDTNPTHSRSNTPWLGTAYYTGDSIVVSFRSLLLNNRKSLHIDFQQVGYRDMRPCKYPGPNWQKTINTKDCVAEYVANLPFTDQDNTCGFQRTVSGNYLTYQANLQITYVETVSVGGSPYDRTVSYPYNLTVSIPHMSYQSFSAVATGGDSLVWANPAGVFQYDSTTRTGSMNVITTVPWPLQIPRGVVLTSPQGTTVSFTQDYSLSADYCSNTPGSSCQQRWVVTVINGATNCYLGGDYSISSYLTCRGISNCPSHPNAILQLRTSGNIFTCGSSDPVVDLTLPSMAPFNDSLFFNPTTSFKVGNTAYLMYMIMSKDSAIDSVTFDTITLLSGTSSDPSPQVIFDSNDDSIGSRYGVKTMYNNNLIVPPNYYAKAAFALNLTPQMVPVLHTNSSHIITPAERSSLRLLSFSVVGNVTYHYLPVPSTGPEYLSVQAETSINIWIDPTPQTGNLVSSAFTLSSNISVLSYIAFFALLLLVSTV
eukprot:TRINITY_DN284_c0_g1_i2.p1 TRINITY_DN284_c0_g1~~TRINITY_DN284_c0_g1_i2.p1  ORF type:complete len:552 (-),score=105.74 TRINITY_DN284_c0_g1_i2:120-1775(-)